MFSYRHIEYFVTTIEEGSISAAAKKLGVSSQAISKAINDMEESLGRPLFTRKSSGLKPTPFGSSLLRKGRKVLSETEDFERYARGLSSGKKKTARFLLCAPKFANFHHVSERISTFIEKFTDLDVELKRASAEDCIEKLAIGAIDAFVTIGKTDLPQFDVSAIDLIEVGALMAKGHPYARKAALTLEDFIRVPLFFTPTFSFFSDTINEAVMPESSLPAKPWLKPLDMSIHGIFGALVREAGCVVMPNIHGVDNWLPETCVVPFDESELARVPLNLVTDKVYKTYACKALERLLVERNIDGAHFDVEEKPRLNF